MKYLSLFYYYTSFHISNQNLTGKNCQKSTSFLQHILMAIYKLITVIQNKNMPIIKSDICLIICFNSLLILYNTYALQFQKNDLNNICTKTQHQTSHLPMSVIDLTPSDYLPFKLPNALTSKFKVGNLTLRSVCIYIISLHPDFITLDIQNTIIDPFQQVEVTALLHWSQEINCLFKSKIRVYVWQIYDQQTINNIISKMFNKDSTGDSLHFEQLSVDVDIDTNLLQKINPVRPLAYWISRVVLPNNESVTVTPEMMAKVINYCQKVGQVKAIYTYDVQYVAEFSQLEDVLCFFCEVVDLEDNLAVFAIACLPNLGNIIYSPNMLILTYVKVDSPKLMKKQKNNMKQIQNLEQQNKQQLIKKLKTPLTIPSQQPQQPLIIKQKDNHQQPIQHPEKQRNSPNKNRFKDLVKQSMAEQGKYKTYQRKRSKSQQPIIQCDSDNESIQLQVKLLNQWRVEQNYQLKKSENFQQKCVDFSKKILNLAISLDQKYLYLLFKSCVVICQTQNIPNKKTIKYDPIDDDNVHLPTPMIVVNKQKMLIFANDSYLFWVSLTGEQAPEWKYVQRKEIHTIEVVEELNLLMVGGKNFSKLAYLGKSTTRSNIKIYSCGKHGKRDHLFTYDIPDCTSENVIEMKYITTRPNGTKLLLVLTSQGKLYFLRVKAFNHLQIYSCFNSVEIGIQQIVSINYHIGSSILICMQKLSEEHRCLKYIKANCTYEKVQIFTESVKLPVVKYFHQFRLGGKQGNEWVTAIDQKYNIYSMYLEWKQPKIKQYKKQIKDCILFKKGAIFRENTQILSRILKN